MVIVTYICKEGTAKVDIGLSDLEGYSLEGLEQDELTGFSTITLVNGDERFVIGEHFYRILRQENLNCPLVRVINKALEESSLGPTPLPTREQLRAMRRAMRRDAMID